MTPAGRQRAREREDSGSPIAALVAGEVDHVRGGQVGVPAQGRPEAGQRRGLGGLE